VSGPDLAGTTVLITGAGRGLGRVMAGALAESGANVAIMERDAAEREDAVARIGAASDAARVIGITGDVTKPADAASAVGAASEAFGRLDMLINNAALGPQEHSPSNTAARKPVWTVDLDLWLATLAVNGSGPFIMTRAAIPGMIERGWGRIVTVTTSLDTMMAAGVGAYGPAKACAEGFMSILAHEVEGSGVTANVLVPGGPTNTGFIPANAPFDRAALVQPDVMVAPILWLASAASDGITDCRFVGRDWDPAAPGAASAPAAWPGLGTAAAWPGAPSGRT